MKNLFTFFFLVVLLGVVDFLGVVVCFDLAGESFFSYLKERERRGEKIGEKEDLNNAFDCRKYHI